MPWPGSCLALQENVSSFLSQRQSYELRATELVWTTHHWTALEKEINLSCLKSLCLELLCYSSQAYILSNNPAALCSSSRRASMHILVTV